MGFDIPTPGGGDDDDETGGSTPGSGFPLIEDTDVGGFRLMNLANPVDGQDAVTLSSIGAAVSMPISDAVNTHSIDTTAVHGIPDTSALLDTSDIGVSVQAYDPDLADLAGISDVQGDILVRGAVGWERLAKSGTSTHVLTAGASQPTWAAPSGASQTPWTSDIDADAFDLTDVAQLAIGTGSPASTTALTVTRTEAALAAVNRIGMSITDALTWTSVGGNSYIGLNIAPSLTTPTGTGLIGFTGIVVNPTLVGNTTFGALIGYGVNATMTVSAGTVSSVYVFNASTAGAGTIGTVVGLAITNLATGTTKWGMQVGNYQSYHEGPLRVGAAAAGSALAPSAPLDVWTYYVSGIATLEVARFSSNFSIGGVASERIFQSTGNTTTATPLAIDLITTIASSTSYLIESRVLARRGSGASGTAEDSAAYVLLTLVKNVAGTATKIGTTVQTIVGESQAGWDATHTVTGATLQITVTGAASNTVGWRATTRIYTSP